jgi:hypothetical protein
MNLKGVVQGKMGKLWCVFDRPVVFLGSMSNPRFCGQNLPLLISVFEISENFNGSMS